MNAPPSADRAGFPDPSSAPASRPDPGPTPDASASPPSDPAPTLGVDETIERLAHLRRNSLNLFVERRQQRPEGAPTRIQEHVLLALRDGGALQVSEIAALLGVAAATTSQMLSAMEEKGWLQRGMLPQDRRRHQATLTPAGRDLVQQMEARRRKRFAQLLAQMSPEERARLVAMANRVVDLLARRPEDPDEEGLYKA